MKKIIPFILMSVFFTSCVWIPVTKNGKIREKTTLKDFNDVQNPLMISFEISDSFGLYGNTKIAENKAYIGSVLAVYDWENDKVVDYIYSSEAGYGVLPAVKTSDGSNVYYFNPFDYGKKIYSINSASAEEKGLEKIKVSEKAYSEYYVTEYPDSDYGKELIVYRKSYDSSKRHTIYGARFINPDTNLLEEEMEYSSYSGNPVFATDKNNDVWFTYEVTAGEKSNKENTNLVKINAAKNKIEDPLVIFDNYENATYDVQNGWSESYRYEVAAVTDEGIILLKKHYKSVWCDNQELIYVQKQTGSVTEIADSTLDARSHCCDVVNCDGNILAFVHFDDSDEKSSYKVYELNLEENKFCEVSTEGTLDFGYYNNVKVFCYKVIFVKTDSDNVEIQVYDSSTRSFGSKKTISVGDFAENYTNL